MYENGLGVKWDYAKALMWYRKAADQGHVGAQRRLGNMYAGNVYAGGIYVAEDLTESAKWFRKAAEQGDSFSQTAIGAFFEQGLSLRDHTEPRVEFSHGLLAFCTKSRVNYPVRDVLGCQKWLSGLPLDGNSRPISGVQRVSAIFDC